MRLDSATNTITRQAGWSEAKTRRDDARGVGAGPCRLQGARYSVPLRAGRDDQFIRCIVRVGDLLVLCENEDRVHPCLVVAATSRTHAEDRGTRGARGNRMAARRSELEFLAGCT